MWQGYRLGSLCVQPWQAGLKQNCSQGYHKDGKAGIDGAMSQNVWKQEARIMYIPLTILRGGLLLILRLLK